MKQYIGVDIGGTSAKYGLIAEDGTILRRGSFQTAGLRSREPFVSRLFAAVDGLSPEAAEGIGVCTLGAVDPERGLIADCANNLPFLEGLNLKQVLQEQFRLPVKLCNDANAVALCEHWLGAGRGCAHFFCVTFGTGLGAALVIHSKIYEGAHLRAGEVCYQDYSSGEENLEKEISTQNVMKRAAERLGLPALDGRGFFSRLRAGDAVVAEEFARWMDRSARMLANIITVFDPEKIIIGGGISSESGILLPELRTRVAWMLPQEFRKDVVIEAAQFTNDAGILGAVSPFVSG